MRFGLFSAGARSTLGPIVGIVLMELTAYVLWKAPGRALLMEGNDGQGTDNNSAGGPGPSCNMNSAYLISIWLRSRCSASPPCLTHPAQAAACNSCMG